MPEDKPLLRAEHLEKHFSSASGLLDRLLGRSAAIRAVDDVTLELYPGETLGVVGESGCGKTTLGRTLLRLLEPTAGRIYYRHPVDGSSDRQEIELTAVSDSRLRDLRTNLQYIFQDPFSSLNPQMTVGEIIGEPLDIHDIATGQARTDRIHELLRTVGLAPQHIEQYPHEFSGGQRQRIGIARALAVDPDIIVCDEPVSALDVSVQAQILNLLADLQDEFDLSYLFIAHDLSVVEHLADRIAVMYLGEFVETGSTQAIFNTPSHPYTTALLSAIPEPDPAWDGQRVLLSGDVPSPADPPSGCRFHPRCPAIIPPPDVTLAQPTWRGLMDLKQRLVDADRLSAVVATTTVDDNDALRSTADTARVDPTTVSRDRLDTLVRSEFDLPSPLPDATADAALTTAIDHLAEHDLDAAVSSLAEVASSPCETTVPADTAITESHTIACLRYDDQHAADAWTPDRSAEASDAHQ